MLTSRLDPRIQEVCTVAVLSCPSYPYDIPRARRVLGCWSLIYTGAFAVDALARSIINNVLNVFRPKRWVLTMVADKAGLNTITENPFNVEQVSTHDVF